MITGWLCGLFWTCLYALSPMECRPWWDYVGGRHRSNPSPGAQQTGGGSKDVEGGHKAGAVFRVTWGAEAGNHMSRHYRAQDTEAGAALPEQEALESQGEGRGEGRQAGLWG